MEAAETSGLPALSVREEPASPSNEQLLQRLAQSVESRRRHRNKQKAIYAGYYVVCTLFGIAMMAAPFFSLVPSFTLGMEIPLFIFVFAFLAFNNWFNQRYYRRTAQQRDAVVLELAGRGEERALGPLLELMDMRMSVSSINWGASRVVFIEALGRLLANLSPASFAELSDAQVHQLMPLLLLPEPELRAGICEALCRSGDARALRSLRKYEGMYQVQRFQKFNPFLSLMKTWFRKRKIPMLDKENIVDIKRCCGEIEPRAEAEKRLSQLLRASESGLEQPANQLLRGAMPDTNSAHVEQLLHPASPSLADEEEAQTAELETVNLAARNLLPTTPHAQIEAVELEEVKLTRG